MGWLTGYVVVVTSWPTGHVGVMTSWLTVGWWADGAANRVGWTGDQLADSGVVGLMGWLTVQLECLPFDQRYEAWVIHFTNSMCSADVWHMAHLSCFTI